jgi:hypothetical protein
MAIAFSNVRFSGDSGHRSEAPQCISSATGTSASWGRGPGRSERGPPVTAAPLADHRAYIWKLLSPCHTLHVQCPKASRLAPFERVSATVGLCFRETGFCGAETAASKRPVTFNRSSAVTKRPHENPPVRPNLQDTGKSLFVWDCVVELGGLEPPTKRILSRGGRSTARPFQPTSTVA